MQRSEEKAKPTNLCKVGGLWFQFKRLLDAAALDIAFDVLADFITDENGITRERTESKQFVYKTDEDSFYAVFISYVKWLYRINSAVTIKVLLYMLEIAEFNTGRVSLTTGERSNIMEELHISSQALSRSVKELVSVDAIRKNYIVNRETGEQRERKGDYPDQAERPHLHPS